MRDLAPALRRLLAADTRFVLATTVGVRGSAPRPVGTSMAVDERGRVFGSLSGGCVEAAVHHAATEALATGTATLRTFGLGVDGADGSGAPAGPADQAVEGIDALGPAAGGLSCGGSVEVLVQPVDRPGAALLRELLVALEGQLPVALATVVPRERPRGPRPGALLLVRPERTSGSLGSPDLDRAVAQAARALLAAARDSSGDDGWDAHDGLRRIEPGTVFVQTFAPPPRMLVFGAVDPAGAVAHLGAFLGYRVTVCDAREAFTTADRFPDADEVVVAWPHDHLARTAVDARTVICVLTHEARFDVPLLELALRGPAAYVGAMGSRATRDGVVGELLARGVTREQLARLHAPIGLDTGARTAAETAVSIAAEITRTRRGGSGVPLVQTRGPVHDGRRAAPSAAPAAAPVSRAVGTARETC